jgi:hypothetical protein
LQQGRFPLDLHLLCELADFQRQVDLDAILHVQKNVRSHCPSESLQLRRHAVRANPQSRKHILAAGIRGRGQRHVGAGLRRRHRDARHHRAGPILDGADDRCGIGLRDYSPRKKDGQRQNKETEWFRQVCREHA